MCRLECQRNLKTSIILTSNNDVSAWREVFGDTTVAAGLLDRLLHRCVVLNLDGDFYRLREHQARGEGLRAACAETRQPLRRTRHRDGDFPRANPALQT